ncbi:hypothetical protein C8R45DRAFT_937005 [Mycena sanguinolenta]|nr:hypothetical protein C8R45DRAFT_937005 [Mycena sanguinolenta]
MSRRAARSSPQATEQLDPLALLSAAAVDSMVDPIPEDPPNPPDIVNIDDSDEDSDSDFSRKICPPKKRPKLADASQKPSPKKTTQKPKSKAASKPKKKDQDPIPVPTEFEILVPTAQKANRVITIPFDYDFDSAVEQIFKAIGCEDVARKPELSYKVSPRAKVICLDNDKAWTSLRNTIETKFIENKGKKTIQIEICVSAEYLDALARRSAAKTTKKKGPGRPSARKVVDLDHTSGDEPDDDAGQDSNAMEEENTEYDRLERKYKGKCELCSKTNPDSWCKIGQDGTHVLLTFNQRQAWAAALSQQKHGVTYDTTPNTDLFIHFHTKATAPAPAPAPVPAPPTTPASSSGVLELLAMSVAESQRTNTTMLASLLAPGRILQPLPSFQQQSSPTRGQADRDGGDFGLFMAELDGLHPKRQLSRFIDTLANKEECLTVRDLRDLGAEYLKNNVNVPAATANWLINMARARVSGAPLP